MAVLEGARPASPVARTVGFALTRSRVGLLAVLLLSAVLNLVNLDRAGYGNGYYAAAVRSMLQGWHPFFFASFDPVGFVTVDKPALGLWVQTAFAKLLGFSGIAILLPQALATVASVGLLYWLVRRRFGVAAGLIAALALALTPIAVALGRTNELDSLLVLMVLLAAWAMALAAETGRLRWLLLAAAVVGLGFNVKMLQAYVVLPAFYLTYLLGAPVGWWRRCAHLAAASAVLLAVSLAWAVAVDLTPPDQRPYIGSSQENSVLNLALGYNGLNRVAGLAGFRRGFPAVPANPGEPGAGPAPAFGAGTPPAGLPGGTSGGAFGGPAGGPNNPAAGPTGGAFPAGVPGAGAGRGGMPAGGPMMDGGVPGPTRLFDQALGGQIGWLIPFALVGGVAAASLARWRLPLPPRAQSLVLWGTWLVVVGLVFSFASGIFHRYYTVMLAPPIAALTGIGTVALWRACRLGWRHGLLLPLAVAATAAVQVRMLLFWPDWARWIAPVVGGVAFLALVGLLAVRAVRRPDWRRRLLPAASAAMAALLVAPAVWAATPVVGRGNGTIPGAGPELLNGGGGGFPGRPAGDQSRLIRFLEANRNGATYLLAAPNAMTAAPIIIATGEPVMAMGGFAGMDPILTAQSFADLVRANTVRYVMTGGFGFGGMRAGAVTRTPGQPRNAAPGGRPAQSQYPGAGAPNGATAGQGGFTAVAGPSATTAWIQANCRPVPPEQWQSADGSDPSTPDDGLTFPGAPQTPGVPGQFRQTSQLYDCAP